MTTASTSSHDLQGVGANLSDHPLAVVTYSASRSMALGEHNIVDVVAACRVDPASTVPDAHMLFLAVPFVPPSRTAPENGYAIAFSMLRPHSRGSVRLATSDPTAPPLIDPAFLTDQRDVDFMVRATRAARELGEAHALQAWRAEEVVPGPGVTSDEDLAAYLRQGISTYFHAAGTCRMGTGPDAVTDNELRVHGARRAAHRGCLGHAVPAIRQHQCHGPCDCRKSSRPHPCRPSPKE